MCQLYEAIDSHDAFRTNFEVKDVSKGNNSYTVEVTVRPLDYLPELDDYMGLTGWGKHLPKEFLTMGNLGEPVPSNADISFKELVASVTEQDLDDGRFSGRDSTSTSMSMATRTVRVPISDICPLVESEDIVAIYESLHGLYLESDMDELHELADKQDDGENGARGGSSPDPLGDAKNDHDGVEKRLFLPMLEKLRKSVLSFDSYDK